MTAAATGAGLARHIEVRRLADLRLLALNAQFMTHEQFQALVGNIRRDGALTSVPLVYPHRGRAEYDELDAGVDEVLSGNHRVKAGLEALGPDAESECFIIDQPLSRQQRIAIQLSHNSIVGQSDPTVLKRLYDELDLVDWRQYSGLDDKTLELLDQVEVGSLGEANLDFQTVTVVFLPAEAAAAEQMLAEAKQLAQADRRWLAGLEQHSAVLDALETTHGAYKVGNVATALGLILRVFEAHLGDLRAGWYDEDAGTPRHDGWVPLEAVFECRSMPATAAAVVARALAKMAGRDEVARGQLWQAAELWAADYLAAD